MKLFDYYRNEDCGVENVFTLIKGKSRSFIQLGLSWNEYPDMPYFQLGIGNNRLIDILFWCWRFGFAFELLGITWKSWNEDNRCNYD